MGYGGQNEWSTESLNVPTSHTHTREHTHTHTHTHEHIHVHTHARTHTHTCENIHTHTHTHRHTWAHTHIHAPPHAREHTRTHPHTRKHTHTHTHTEAAVWGGSFYITSTTEDYCNMVNGILFKWCWWAATINGNVCDWRILTAKNTRNGGYTYVIRLNNSWQLYRCLS